MKNKAVGFAFLFVLLFSSCDCVQLAMGTVIDSETKKPIQGAKIYKQQRSYNNSISNEEGAFKVSGISGGLWGCPPMPIVIEKEGYETLRKKGGGIIELKRK